MSQNLLPGIWIYIHQPIEQILNHFQPKMAREHLKLVFQGLLLILNQKLKVFLKAE